MTFDQFNKFQAELFAECVKIRDTKGKEYAHDADRFANFNRLEKSLGIDRLQIAFIYLAKHLDSITSYCKDGKVYSTESIRGRIVDVIVYLTLLAGMIDEREQSTDKQTMVVASNMDNVKCWNCGKEFQSGQFTQKSSIWMYGVENIMKVHAKCPEEQVKSES